MPGSLVYRAAKRFLGPLFWKETYRCLRLPWKEAEAALAAAGSAPGPAEVRVLDRAELRRYAAEPRYEISGAFLNGIAARDDLCFGAFVRGELAAYRFFALRPTAIDAHLEFRFPARWIYAYKAFTLQAWRGKRLHRELFVGSLPEVRRWLAGLQEPLGFVTLVMADNPASAAALSRLGFRPFDSFAVVRLRARPRLIMPSADDARGFAIRTPGSI